MKEKINSEKFRSYSTIFSGLSFLGIINKDDYSFIDKKVERYNPEFIGKTYKSYIKYVYRLLLKNYRCEYVYKNLLISELLIKKYRLNDTIAINEYKVGGSIVDLAMFNGNSKAFEIKTELDSAKRLNTQLNDYQKLFNECYIVTHETLKEKYLNDYDNNIGVIILYQEKNNYYLEEIRPSYKNIDIDEEVLIKSIRTDEYKYIIKKFYGEIPNVNSFKMFDSCLSLMKNIPKENLQSLYLEVIKRRQKSNKALKIIQPELKQICLSLNLSSCTYSQLDNKLDKPILI